MYSAAWRYGTTRGCKLKGASGVSMQTCNHQQRAARMRGIACGVWFRSSSQTESRTCPQERQPISGSQDWAVTWRQSARERRGGRRTFVGARLQHPSRRIGNENYASDATYRIVPSKEVLKVDSTMSAWYVWWRVMSLAHWNSFDTWTQSHAPAPPLGSKINMAHRNHLRNAIRFVFNQRP